MFIGIDPGQTGAAVLYDGEKIIDCADYSDPVEMSETLLEWQDMAIIHLAILEKVASMPKQGVSSVFKFGTNFGIWQGILSALRIRHELVTPQAWQKGIITKTDGADSKARSLCVARRLFPNSLYFKRKMDHNRADAALMAVFASRRDKI